MKSKTEAMVTGHLKNFNEFLADKSRLSCFYSHSQHSINGLTGVGKTFILLNYCQLHLQISKRVK